MWIPATRGWMGGARWTLSKYHAGVGFAMVVVPLLVMLVLDRRRLARGVREVDSWTANDRRWFWAALRGHTLRGRPMPAQGRLNAGQKASTILVAVMAVGFAATGGVLLGRADLPAWLVSRAFWLHDFLVVAGIALLAGHLAHVFLTKHGRRYLGAMVRGALPEEVARERHRTWWEAHVRDSDRPPDGTGAGENYRPPPGE
jgi:cytochrome b subunit of formate dehydrogenase